ncbi:hypothetical protein MASR2M66_29620 [Chloroflexota bacterium]
MGNDFAKLITVLSLLAMVIGYCATNEADTNEVDTSASKIVITKTPSDFVRFEQVTEDIKEFPPTSFPINNCGGVAEVTQEVAYSYTHEVVDETGAKLGVDIPVVEWLGVVAEIEKRYAITDKETTSYSTTLTVPAGQNIRYTVIRKQTWESGIVVKNTNGIETRAAYSVLKNESIEVANSEILGCP